MKKGLTAQAREEILSLEFGSDCCARAFLSGLIHSSGSLLFEGKGRLSVLVRRSSDSLKTRIDSLLNRLYSVTSVADEHTITIDRSARKILTDCAILSGSSHLEIVSGIDSRLIKNTCCKRAYAGGAFVGSGSLSASRRGYHLEFAFLSPDLARDFLALLASEDIQAKQSMRRNKYICYIKNNDSIGDCLAFCGTGKMTLHLSREYVVRDTRRLTNARFNCEMANLDRAISAGVRQAEMLKSIEGTIEDERLRATAQARIQNPESSYEQLAKMLGVTKSGIKHRLHKLEELYHRLHGSKNSGED